MPFYIIERTFIDEVQLPLEEAPDINLINDEEDVRWLYSFLSVDHRKTYCLYEAPSIEAIRDAARRADLPADAVVEVAGQVMPTGVLTPFVG